MHRIRHHKHRAVHGRHRISRLNRFHGKLVTMKWSRIGVSGGLLWAALSAPTSTSRVATGIAYLVVSALLTVALISITVHFRTVARRSLRHMYRPKVADYGYIHHKAGAMRRKWDSGIVVHKRPGYALKRSQRNYEPIHQDLTAVG